MEEYIVKDGKKLRLGYTTGSCAAAAAKAAAVMLLTGRRLETVALLTPKGIRLELEVREVETGPGYVSCAIAKDAGDDPDVTNGSSSPGWPGGRSRGSSSTAAPAWAG